MDDVIPRDEIVTLTECQNDCFGEISEFKHQKPPARFNNLENERTKSE